MPGRTRPSGTRVLAATQVIATALVVASVWLLYGRGEAVGLLGVVVGIAVHRAVDERRRDRDLAAALGDIRAADAVTPAVDLPPRAHDPVAEAAAVLRHGAGVVRCATGVRVVTAGDLQDLPVQLCLRGDWVRTAHPAQVVAADQRLGDLARLPRGRDAWAVLVGDLPLGVLTRRHLEVLARRRMGPDGPGPACQPAAPPTHRGGGRPRGDASRRRR